MYEGAEMVHCKSRRGAENGFTVKVDGGHEGQMAT